MILSLLRETGSNMTDFVKYTGELWRCGNLYRTARYGNSDIGSYQDSYIVNVCAHPGITQEELSSLIFVHKSNVARQLCSLEEKGFIKRETDPADKRGFLVYPTKKAYSVLREIESVTADWKRLVLDGFTQDEIDAVEKLSAKLAENAKRIVGEKEGKKTEGKR